MKKSLRKIVINLALKRGYTPKAFHEFKKGRHPRTSQDYNPINFNKLVSSV